MAGKRDKITWIWGAICWAEFRDVLGKDNITFVVFRVFLTSTCNPELLLNALPPCDFFENHAPHTEPINCKMKAS